MRKVLAGVALVVSLALFLRIGARRHAAPHVVTPGLEQLHGGLVDCYAVRTSGGVILFDAGVDPTTAPAEGVRDLFLTHGHLDHVAAAPILRGARVWAGRDDVAAMAGQGGRGRLVATLLRAVIGVPRVVPSDVIEARRTIPVAGGEVLAIPAPGHTAGSVVYFFRGVLFAGDALTYQEERLVIPFAEDAAAARRSVATLPSLLPPGEPAIVCTGHGGCTPPGSGRRLLDEAARRWGRDRVATPDAPDTPDTPDAEYRMPPPARSR
jgi:glyoxylase-like metal-dependent hydrolase (beta-lactamase superfamily II)